MGFSVVVGKDIIFLWVENAMAETFFFFLIIFWFKLTTVMLQIDRCCSNTKTEAGQPE